MAWETKCEFPYIYWISFCCTTSIDFAIENRIKRLNVRKKTMKNSMLPFENVFAKMIFRHFFSQCGIRMEKLEMVIASTLPLKIGLWLNYFTAIQYKIPKRRILSKHQNQVLSQMTWGKILSFSFLQNKNHKWSFRPIFISSALPSSYLRCWTIVYSKSVHRNINNRCNARYCST